MSKTTKLRRLKGKVSQLENRICGLEWSNQNLMKELQPAPLRHYTQPPEFRGSNHSEEQYYQKLINYIYSKMDQLYNDAIERDWRTNIGDIKFTLYINRRTLMRLSSTAGYRDLESTPNGYTFRGHKVVEVIGDEHINFVRTA
jgi:CRISPR/Cas system CSM-associated protein Csm3 (group 7 of RAMP superfamily)